MGSAVCRQFSRFGAVLPTVVHCAPPVEGDQSRIDLAIPDERASAAIPPADAFGRQRGRYGSFSRLGGYLVNSRPKKTPQQFHHLDEETERGRVGIYSSDRAV